jgi:hypothetical protein
MQAVKPQAALFDQIGVAFGFGHFLERFGRRLCVSVEAADGARAIAFVERAILRCRRAARGHGRGVAPDRRVRCRGRRHALLDDATGSVGPAGLSGWRSRGRRAAFVSRGRGGGRDRQGQRLGLRTRSGRRRADDCRAAAGHGPQDEKLGNAVRRLAVIAVEQQDVLLTQNARQPDGLRRGSSARAPGGVSGGANGAELGGLESVGPIRVIADPVNNALLILASRSGYEIVRAALRQLDIRPLQVVIDATIAEASVEPSLEALSTRMIRDRN